MAIVVDATFENGVLKPTRSLPLKEHERVQITINTLPVSQMLDAYGIMGWTGDAGSLERLALDPEFDPEDDV